MVHVKLYPHICKTFNQLFLNAGGRYANQDLAYKACLEIEERKKWSE